MKKKNTLKLIFGIIFSGIIIYFTAKSLGGLNPYILLSADINWALAVLSGLIFVFAVFIRALVYPFGIDKSMKINQAFDIVAIGNAANMVLPLRLGEGLRAALFPRNFSPSKRTWLLMVPAAADLLSILTISELALPLSGFNDPVLIKILHTASLIFLVIIVLLLILLFSVPRFKLTAELFVHGSVLKMILWTFSSWLVMLASIYVGLMAFGYDVQSSFKMSFAIFASTNIVTFLPSSPGGIGLFEYGVVLGMKSLGIQRFPGKEVGLLIHIIQYAVMLPLGATLYIASLRRKKLAAIKATSKKVTIQTPSKKHLNKR